MVTITLPDGARREYPVGVNGATIAESISKSLARKAVAMKVDGVLSDLADTIMRDVKVSIVTRDDPDALELIRHDCAHVLAEAVQELFPGTQVTIGPVIDNGFYYDFFRNEPFSTDDFSAMEAKMSEIIARDAPFRKEVWSRDQAREVFEQKGEMF
jgi:threonyl-tRNA synthetase